MEAQLRMRVIPHPLLSLCLFTLGSLAHAQVTEVNVSRDLVRLGIASRNAAADNPKLDSRPLFQAAIAYAQSQNVPVITADRGAYWFLTPQASTSYLVLDHATDLLIDLQGSDIYLKQPFMTGFDLQFCERVALTNFTLDFMTLPFTQVRLSGVSGRNISYDPLPGWPSPGSLTQLPAAAGAEFWGLVLRSGSVPPSTNRLPLVTPFQDGQLQVSTETSPWTQPAVLATYKPGDVVVVTARAGPPAVFVESGVDVRVANIEVYASGSLALQVDASDRALIERIHVMPRPGTDRLISSNADGVHVSFVQADTRVRSCYISRSMDDGIALNSPFLANVVQQIGTRTLQVNNLIGIVEPGYQLAFVDPSTGVMSGTAPLAARVSDLRLSFAADLPAVQSGSGLVYADSAFRGDGTIVENNTVEDILFARGIFLGGVTGVTVRGNTVRRTNGNGIAAHYELSAYPTAPNQNLQILSNTVDSAIGPAAVGSGWVAGVGAIAVLATDSSFQAIRNPVTPNITIANNAILNAGRTAIWVNAIDGGSITGNTISGYGVYPQLATWGASSAWVAQLTQDFAQAIAVRNSRNLAVGSNQY